MTISYIFEIIGNIFFNDYILTIILSTVILYFLIKGLEDPTYLVCLYFSCSIINPQSLLNTFSSITILKIVFFLLLISTIINSNKLIFNLPKNLIFFVLFLLASLISYTNAIDPDLSSKRFWEFNKIFLVYLLAFWALASWNKYLIFYNSLIYSFYFLILKTLAETQTKGKWYAVGGTGGWIADSNDYALAVAMIIPFIYIAVIEANSIGRKIFHGGWLIAAGLVLTITSSRGGFLAAVAAILVLLFTEAKKKYALGILITGTIIVSIYMPPSYLEQIKSIVTAKEHAEQIEQDESLAQHQNEEYTGAERVWNWKIAKRMMNDYPFTGVGWGNYVPSRRLYESNPGDTVCHSTWFQVGSETGYTGLTTYLLLLTCSLASLWQCYRYAKSQKFAMLENQTRAVMAGIFAFCIGGTFVSREYSDLLFAFLLIVPLLYKFKLESQTLNGVKIGQT